MELEASHSTLFLLSITNICLMVKYLEAKKYDFRTYCVRSAELLQPVSTLSSCDSPVKKPDVLQREERQEEDCKGSDGAVYEVTLWPLDQTQGT